MNVALRRTMTLEQFLAWEERQPLRYEFDGFGPVARAGGTAALSMIQGNLITALATRLRRKACQVFGSHLKVEAAGRIRYPDAFVVCTPVSPQATVVREPVVVFEILSKSTAGVDLITKNAEYRATPSVQRYVVLQQDAAACMVFSHRHGEWATDTLIGLDQTLAMPEIGVEVGLGEIYEGVAFPEPEI